MATSAATLVQRARRFVGDWNEADALTASVTSGATTISVADATVYGAGWLIQVDSEVLYVASYASTGTSVTVRRGVRGSTGASHASGATVLLRPAWTDLEYLDAFNSGINACWPLLYKPYLDTSITTVAGTYEYTVPNWDGSNPIPRISRIDFKESGDNAYRPIRDWEIKRGSTPLLKFRRYMSPGNLRIHGFGPLPPLTSLTDSLDALFPTNAEDALTFYAAQYLLESGEARRVRQDTGAKDERENANQVGSSQSAANATLQRFQMRLQAASMPPLPPNIKSVF